MLAPQQLCKSWFERDHRRPLATRHHTTAPQPRASRTRERDVPIPLHAETQVAAMFEVLNHDVHYTLSGPVHGRLIALITAISEPISTWMQFVDGISAQGFRVLSCAFRAHLEYADEPSTTVYAQRFEALLRDLGLDRNRMSIIAHGSGAPVAAAYISMRSALVWQLVLLAPARDSSFRKGSSASERNSAASQSLRRLLFNSHKRCAPETDSDDAEFEATLRRSFSSDDSIDGEVQSNLPAMQVMLLSTQSKPLRGKTSRYSSQMSVPRWYMQLSGNESPAPEIFLNKELGYTLTKISKFLKREDPLDSLIANANAARRAKSPVKHTMKSTSAPRTTRDRDFRRHLRRTSR